MLCKFERSAMLIRGRLFKLPLMYGRNNLVTSLLFYLSRLQSIFNVDYFDLDLKSNDISLFFFCGVM